MKIRGKYIPVLTIAEFSIYAVFLVILFNHGFQRALYPGTTEWGDDFQWLTWLERIANGQVPYRDYLLLYGPLLPYIFFPFYYLLGRTFFTWNLICYVALPLISFLIAVFLAKKIFKKGITRIIFLVSASVFSQWGLFFVQPWDFRVWSGLSLLLIIFSNLKRKWLWVGIYTGIVLFSSIDQGLYLLGTLGGMGVVWGGNHLRQGYSGQVKKIWDFLKGFLIICLPMVLFLAATGAWREFFQFNFFILPEKTVSSFGLPYLQFPGMMLKKGILALISARELAYYFPLAIYLGAGIWILGFIFRYKTRENKKLKFNWIVLFLWIYGVASLKTTLQRSDYEHLSFASIPALILFIKGIEGAIFSLPEVINKERKIILRILKISLILVFSLGGLTFLYLQKSTTEKGFLTLLQPQVLGENKHLKMKYNPILKVYLNPDHDKSVNEITKFLNDKKNYGIYNHGFFEGAFFLTKTANPTYFDQDFWATEKEQEILIAKLEELRTTYIVSLKYDLFYRGSIFTDYLFYYYRPIKYIGDLTVFERTDRPFNPAFIKEKLTDHFNNRWKLAKTSLYTADESFRLKTTIAPTRIWQVRLAVKLTYIPGFSSFAKTKATLLYRNSMADDTNWKAVGSDTRYVPSYLPSGQLNFHLLREMEVDSLQIVFSSPGAFNPKPTGVEIVETWIYQ